MVALCAGGNCNVLLHTLTLHRSRLGRVRSLSKICLWELEASAKWKTKLAEVLLRKIMQDRLVNRIFAKCSVVLLKPEASAANLRGP